MKNFVRQLSWLPTPERDRVRALLCPADLRVIDESSPTDWLPLAVNVKATDVVWSSLASPLREDLFRRMLHEDLESSYLRSLVTSAVLLFGPSPGSFVKWVPRGWGAMFKDSGEVAACDVTASSARLVYTALDVQIVESPCWLASTAASLRALIDLAKLEGDVSVVDRDTARRTGSLLFRWH
jgi:hypothetical protein